MSADNSPAESQAAGLRQSATRGALWVTLTSATALPLGYYRSWVLGRLGDDGSVVGSYAIILLFIQVVITFVLFGGSSVVTNFMPKIGRAAERSAFIIFYGALSAVLLLLFVAAINLFPSLVSAAIRQPIDTTTLRVLTLLAPGVVISQIIIFCLAGMMDFKISSILSQLQLFAICLVGTAGWLFFPEFTATHPLALLGATAGGAAALAILLGAWRLRAVFTRPDAWIHVPPNFWKFSTSVHANSVSVFAYQSIDQIIILSAVGTAELGAYFVLLQCAQLITFIPQRIGQVMLASFSRLVAENETQKLCHAYRRLCRAILILSTPIALFLISFSRPIASIFGDWSAERHLYLLSLAAAIYVGTLGSVNSMLIMAKERTGLFLGNSIVLITLQLAVSLALVERWGAYAVIVGKACGIVSGQIGLFSIVRWGLDDIAIGPPREAWYGFATVGACVLIASLRTPLSLSEGLLLFACATALFLAVIRFRPAEIMHILGISKKNAVREA